jgi:tetratricopeptide (TPR) repeat protein
MGSVYLVRDGGSDRLVALKVVGTDAGPGNAAILRRLRREFRLMQRLRHEHIVEVYELFEDGGLQFFSMEYVGGGNLHSHLGVGESVTWQLSSERSTAAGHAPGLRDPAAGRAQRRWTTASRPLLWDVSDEIHMEPDEEGSTASFAQAVLPGHRWARPPSADAVAAAIQQLLEALSFIHAHGVVHRDLKPSNILMAPHGVLKLMDFGVARPAELEDVSSMGQIVGTYAYMSPEQAEGKDVDGRADLYAVGVLLYELLVGQPPFVGSTPMEVLWKHVHAAPTDPLRLRPDADPELAETAMRCLQKEARNRFADARSVLRTLETRASRRPSQPPPAEAGRPSILYTPHLVGRDGETAALRGHLHEAVAGRGTWVMLSGEGGIGKSRLVADLRGHARLSGVRLLRGRCRPGGATYEGFRGVLQGVVARFRPSLPDGLPAAVRRSAPVLASVFPVVRELGVPQEVSSGSDLPPHEGRQRVLLAARDIIFAAVADSPALLVVEDLHVADHATITLLGILATALRDRSALPSAPQLLIVGTERDDEVDAASAHLVQRLHERLVATGAAHRLLLRPLDRAQVGELAASMTGVTPSDAAVDRLHAESGGNPAFLEELLKAWRDDTVSHASVPPTLVAAVAQRTSRLSSRARQVGEVAAVLGRECATETLIAATGLPEAEVLDAVEELVHRRLLAEDQQYGREIVRFRQEVTRRSIADSLPLARRRALHVSAARALEAAIDAPTEIVGQHYLAGGEHEAARRHLERAASEAASSYANEDALRLYDLALEASREVGGSARERFRLLSARAAVLDHLARREEERRTIEEAERLARQSGDPGLRCDAFIRWAEHYNVTAEGDKAEEMAKRALESARSRADRFREARALRELGRSYATRGDHERCFELLQDQLALAQDLGDLPMEATALGMVGVCQMALGDFVVARLRLLDAADRWRRIGDQRSLAAMLFSVALVDEGMGGYAEALRLLTEVLRIRREIGHRHGEAQACAALVNTRRLLGDLEGAWREGETALRLAGDVESASIASLTHLYLAQTDLDAQDLALLPATIAQATAAASEARDAGDLGLEARSLAVLAEAARRAGRLPEAEALSERAIGQITVRGYASFGGEEEVLYTRARVLEDMGSSDASRDALGKAYSRVRTKSERIEDLELRRRFLEAVPLHRAIVEDWEGRRPA